MICIAIVLAVVSLGINVLNWANITDQQKRIEALSKMIDAVKEDAKK